eukprot:Sspe_Gene.10480::Locus_3507_Transcript_1_1_Confidence_1.000_Length_2639::g.10480::m.10480/K10609/CUL4; cullin 4
MLDDDGEVPSFGLGDGSVRLKDRSNLSQSRRDSTSSRKGKLQIKPFRTTPATPGDFVETSWGKLKAAVDAVYTQSPVQYLLEELYEAVEDLCINQHGQQLASWLQSLREEYTRKAVEQLLQHHGGSAEQFLTALGNLWEYYCEQTMFIKTIFSYFDRTHLFHTHQKTIWDTGIQLFQSFFVQHHAKKTAASLIELIQHERDRYAVDKLLLHKIIRMLLSLKLYKETFEVQFLETTRVFYRQESARELRKGNGIENYLHLVDQRLQEEVDRVNAYLDSSTMRALVGETEAQLLTNHSADIIAKGFNTLLDNHNIEDLALLYRLLKLPRVNKLLLLRDAFKDYIKEMGHKKVSDEANDAQMIPELLGFKKRMDEVLNEAFGGQKEFEYALKDSFEAFMNERANKPAELLARYLDGKMKSGKEPEAELDRIMDSCLGLFRLMQSKDMFEAFYKKDFAKRLLLNKTANIDAEKAFIAKLKAEAGPGFTNKMEGMLQDLEVSKEITAQFKQSTFGKDQRIADVGLQVQVLTTSHWPSFPQCQVLLPTYLSDVLESFKKYYTQKYNGRRLQWQSNVCQCMVKATCPKWRKELIVSLHQALVLLLFNDTKEFTLSEIKEKLGADAGEVKRTMQSLCLGQARILLRKGGSKELDDADVFTVNEDFQHKHVRIRVNQVLLRETQEEARGCSEKVFRDRIYTIDACIARIMKSRKTLQHSALVNAVFGQLKFPLKSADLKKRIESLIEKGILNRDESEPSLYHYVA